jgi:hypothetical protein
MSAEASSEPSIHGSRVEERGFGAGDRPDQPDYDRRRETTGGLQPAQQPETAPAQLAFDRPLR